MSEANAAERARLAPFRSPGRGLAAMVLATALWGATFVVIRDSLAAVPPVSMVFARFAGAAVLMGIVATLRRARFSASSWRAGLIGGVCAGCGYLFQAIGLQFTSAGSSAFLTCTGTLFAGLFAWPLLGLRPGAVLVAGLGLAALGSALLPAQGVGFGPGELWTLVGALAYAFQIVVVAREADTADPVAVTFLQSLVIALLLAPIGAADLAVLAALRPVDLARLGYLAVAGSMIAPWLQVYAQRHLPPGRIGLLFALEPMFAIVFAVGLGGERYQGPWWLGAALILSAVVLVEASAARRERG
jgi:drug/metabolite transporter (DMT)-like permease